MNNLERLEDLIAFKKALRSAMIYFSDPSFKERLGSENKGEFSPE
jgi:hypothetical protein